MAKLTVRDLSYRYRTGGGVSGINFRVEAGRAFGLVGPNGAGKSTILRTCLGLHQPESGEVLIETPTGPMGPTTTAAKHQIGYIPEMPVLIDDLTAWDHLRYLAMAYGLPKAVFHQRAVQLLKRFKLWEDRDADPFSGLDALAQAELYQIFDQLKRDGKAIVLSTHHLMFAEQLCDEFLLLHHGHPLVEGDLEEVRWVAGEPGASLDRCFIKLAGEVS